MYAKLKIKTSIYYFKLIHPHVWSGSWCNPSRCICHNSERVSTCYQKTTYVRPKLLTIQFYLYFVPFVQCQRAIY